MNWSIEFLPEAKADLDKLDGSVRPQVLKGIAKIRQNPLSDGYLGSDLSGLMKIKFKRLGIRVVYKTEIVDNVVKIIIISARSDGQVYEEAEKRRKKHSM